jgi:hypothetical protein
MAPVLTALMKDVLETAMNCAGMKGKYQPECLSRNEAEWVPISLKALSCQTFNALHLSTTLTILRIRKRPVKPGCRSYCLSAVDSGAGRNVALRKPLQLFQSFL